MWRRVPCEQPLHTGQSILSPRRNPMLMVAGCFDRSRLPAKTLEAFSLSSNAFLPRSSSLRAAGVTHSRTRRSSYFFKTLSLQQSGRRRAPRHRKLTPKDENSRALARRVSSPDGSRPRW
jgi:hypothetical protein